MNVITQSELARELNVSRQRINSLILSKKLTSKVMYEGCPKVIVKDKKYIAVKEAYNLNGAERIRMLKSI